MKIAKTLELERLLKGLNRELIEIQKTPVTEAEIGQVIHLLPILEGLLPGLEGLLGELEAVERSQRKLKVVERSLQ